LLVIVPPAATKRVEGAFFPDILSLFFSLSPLLSSYFEKIPSTHFAGSDFGTLADYRFTFIQNSVCEGLDSVLNCIPGAFAVVSLFLGSKA